MRALRTLTWTELKLVAREPVTLVFSLAFPVMLLVLLLEVFGNQPDEAFRGVGGTDFYVPAYAASVIAAVGLIGLPVHVAGYKERGVLRRLRASGVSVATVLATQVVVMVVVVAVGAALMVVLGFVAYDLAAPVAAAGVVAAFLVGALAFAALGFLMAALLPTARAAQAVGLLLFFSMFFISGAGPPRDILPDWVVSIGDWLPMTHLVTAVQDPWIGLGWNGGQLVALVVLLVVSALGSIGLARGE